MGSPDMPKDQGPARDRHARAERMTLNVTAYALLPCCRSHHFIARPTWSGRLDLRGRSRPSDGALFAELHHTPKMTSPLLPVVPLTLGAAAMFGIA